MAQEILEDVGGTLTVYPQVEDIHPGSDYTVHPISSVTCELFKPTESTSFASGSATLDASDYELAYSASTTRSTLVLSGIAGPPGIDVGTHYLYRWRRGNDRVQWHQEIVVADTEGTTIRLESPLLDDPLTGDKIVGLQLSFPVTALNAADRAMNYRCEWTITPAEGDKRKIQTLFHVVRTQFEDAVTPSEALRYAESNMAGAVLSWDAGRSIELAKRASDKVRREIQATGAYPHLIGESESFKNAGLYALKLELAMLGFVPPGFDPGVYATTINDSLKSEIRQTMSSLTWLDADDDAIVDSVERLSGPFTIRVQRQ